MEYLRDIYGTPKGLPACVVQVTSKEATRNEQVTNGQQAMGNRGWFGLVGFLI